VDDNATNRRILLYHLAAWCAESSECDDGPSALREIRSAEAAGRPFRLIVLDMMMPGMTGLDVAREIRRDPALRQPQIVMLTSAGSPLTPDEDRDAALAAHLTKPARKSDLRAALRDAMLGGGAPRRGSVAAPVAATAAPRRHVLVCEDNEVNRRVVTVLLTAIGCEVDAVVNGAEGLRQVALQRFDVIFMDCQMPVLDGFAATRAIREREAAEPGAPRTPIVALTAHAMRADREACLEAGMDDYLSKPFTRDQLRGVIERWAPLAAGRPHSVSAPAPISHGEPSTRDVAAAPTLDARVLAELEALSGDDAFRSQIVAAFIESSTQLASTIETALAAGDAAAIARAAHTLASSSAQIGGMRLAQLSKSLEAQARAPHPGDLAPPSAVLRAELESLHEGLAVESLGVRDV
jgi:CheY-like chemotaxis protein